MEEQPKIAYHWKNQQGESRVTHLTDEEDLAELRQQFLAGYTGLVFVEPTSGVVEGSLIKPITDEKRLIDASQLATHSPRI